MAPPGLLRRLDAIGASLATRGDALALLGLGSVGLETHRLDEHSDLDFFVIVEPGAQQRYIESLDWLAAAHPLVWWFRNTVDGCKALSADGVFCEFAVFDVPQLQHIPYAPGRWVWRRETVDAALAQPQVPMPAHASSDAAWLVGEALSNLIVGLQRLARGETLSAMRLIQGHAVDRLIDLADEGMRRQGRRAGAPVSPQRDPFSRERRVEQRHPSLAPLLAAATGRGANGVASALAILAHLQGTQAVPAAVAEQIQRIAARIRT
jgi:hypothetical protein